MSSKSVMSLMLDPAAVQHFRVHVQKSIQLKVVKTLRDWMKLYWDEDFSLQYADQGPDMQRDVALWVCILHFSHTHSDPN